MSERHSLQLESLKSAYDILGEAFKQKRTELAASELRADHAVAKCQEIAAAYEADGQKIADLEAKLAAVTADAESWRRVAEKIESENSTLRGTVDKLRAAIKLREPRPEE